jgi:hypothetical protein
VLGRFDARVDRAAVLPLRALVALPALLALCALVALPALLALCVLLALAARRVRATAAVFFRAAFFRAALFLADFRTREFARADPFFLVAAALRLAIAVVLSATGLP